MNSNKLLAFLAVLIFSQSCGNPIGPSEVDSLCGSECGNSSSGRGNVIRTIVVSQLSCPNRNRQADREGCVTCDIDINYNYQVRGSSWTWNYTLRYTNETQFLSGSENKVCLRRHEAEHAKDCDAIYARAKRLMQGVSVSSPTQLKNKIAQISRELDQEWIDSGEEVHGKSKFQCDNQPAPRPTGCCWQYQTNNSVSCKRGSRQWCSERTGITNGLSCSARARQFGGRDQTYRFQNARSCSL